jgi:exopolyphosphatase/guanosine-5'-triphosphate,3'-diphosphate pyrophosphatase
MPDYPTLAAVDLGSNSFHLQVARVVGEQIFPLDGLREPIRLGAGLGEDKTLDEPTQVRAIDCLMRFGERLRGLPKGAVRAVGTNTLRVAKNAKAFLRQAQGALGVPVDIIAGREEARLIYLGVAHSLPMTRERRLVVDIGGGSTEFIIGSGLKPLRLESLYMGCVSWSLRFFPDGKITKAALKQAELAARTELQTMAAGFSRKHWAQAVASSGTARSLAEVIQLNGMGDGTISAQGLNALRAHMLKAGDIERLDLAGLRGDRVPVFAGGFAIMSAIVDELKADSITITNGALRQGILWDLLGRVHHHDMRDVTTAQLMRRHHVDAAQAKRVMRLATSLLRQIVDGENAESMQRLISWAASLHEIGITVAYSGYHKHSAYILRNADMPGFSRTEQERLALLVRAHRGQLRKLGEYTVADDDWPSVVALRLATLFSRSRVDATFPEFSLRRRNDAFILGVPAGWLADNPLTETALRAEVKLWRGCGHSLEVRVTAAQGADAALPSAA